MPENPYQSPLHLDHDDGKRDLAATPPIFRATLRGAKIGGSLGIVLGGLTAVAVYFFGTARGPQAVGPAIPMSELRFILIIIVAASTLIGAVGCGLGYAFGALVGPKSPKYQ
jgi:hypothetical protein